MGEETNAIFISMHSATKNFSRAVLPDVEANNQGALKYICMITSPQDRWWSKFADFITMTILELPEGSLFEQIQLNFVYTSILSSSQTCAKICYVDSL